MNLPERILEAGVDHPAQRMLQAAVADQPAPEAKARIKALIAAGAGIGVAGVLGQAAASKTTVGYLTAGVISKWALIGLGVGVVVVGGTQAWRPREHGGRAAAVAAVIPSSPVATAVALASASASSAARAAASSSPKVVLPNAARTNGASLARELALIDEARAALASGDAPGAIAALDRHDAEFHGGTLATESLMLRVEALVRSGDQAGAMRLGKPFCERYPASPQARRVRTLLGMKEDEGSSP
jgi:hypothetical protein